MKTNIAHNNKDLVGKILADTFREKSFAVYGLALPPVKEFLLTEFAEVQITGRAADRLFLLADGSYALVDFESKYLLRNKVKYLRYITRVLDQYLDSKKEFRLRFIVIYTGNVRSAPPDYSTDCLSIRTEQAFLSHINGDEEYKKILAKMEAGAPLTDEDLMMLIILPLTYAKRNLQSDMIDKATDIAAAISEDEKRSFVLAGICISTDTFINKRQVFRIGGLLRMTKVGQMILKEFEDRENDLLKQLEESRNEIFEREAQLAESRNEISEKEMLLAESRNEISEKEALLAKSRNEISHKDALLAESNLNNQKLQQTLDALVQKLLQEGIDPDQIRQVSEGI